MINNLTTTRAIRRSHERAPYRDPAAKGLFCHGQTTRHRQGLRCGGLRRRSARPEHHPARRPRNTANRRSAIDGRTTRHSGYATSQRVRVRLDQDRGRLRQTRHRGTARVGWVFTLTAAARNLVRLPKLLATG